MDIVKTARQEAARIRNEILFAGATAITPHICQEFKLGKKDAKRLAEKFKAAAREQAERLHQQIYSEIDQAEDYNRLSQIVRDLAVRTGGIEFDLGQDGDDIDFEVRVKFFPHPNPLDHPAVFRA